MKEAEQYHSPQLETLAEIARLLSKPAELEHKYREILNEMVRVAGVESIALRIVDEEANALRLVAHGEWGFDDCPPELISLHSLPGTAFMRRAVQINNAIRPIF